MSCRDDFTSEVVIIGVRIWRFRCNWGGREGVAKQQGEWKTQIHAPGQGGTRMEQKEGKTTLMIRAYGSTKYFHIARCDCCRFRFQDYEALVFPMKYSYAHVVLRCKIEVSWQKKKTFSSTCCASIPSNRSPRDVFISTLGQSKTLRAMEIFFFLQGSELFFMLYIRQKIDTCESFTQP